MQHLFTPYTIKDLVLKNRIVMPPMCQTSVEDRSGTPNNWHYIHYASRAVGGAGLIIMEMTNVEPDGRITDRCLGLWSDEQIPAFSRIIEECKNYGAKMAVQIAHAGRKANDAAVPVAPSAIQFKENSKLPRALTTDEVKGMVEKFRFTAKSVVRAGADCIEIHGAHGYLIHQFHSALTNQRNDEYGHDKTRFGVEVIQAIKSEIPAEMPLLMRVSAVEYIENGYNIEDCIEFCKNYKDAGVDMFHISSGGEGPVGPILSGDPGYQVEYARTIRERLQIPVIAVGILEDPQLANDIICNSSADLVAIGRGMLRDPYWALRAAKQLGHNMMAPGSYQKFI